ncbi:MAG: hypothetical protein WC280_02785 [Patescibacteria group bacterium]
MENYKKQELEFSDIYKRESEIKQVEQEMRNYLNKIKGEYPFVLGFLLHGSRLDKKRTPRKDSDVDTVLILEDGNLTASHLEEGRALVEKLVSYIRAHKTDSGFEVEPNDFYTVSEFFTEIDSQEIPKTLSGKSIWGSNPEAFRYIGDSIGQKSETEVNDFLKKELSSDKN